MRLFVALVVSGVVAYAAPARRTAPAPTPVTAPVPAPAPAPTPARPAMDDKLVEALAPSLGCEQLGIVNGLPHSNVLAVVQDSMGFMWFGTQDGLARYDGLGMRVYRPVEGKADSISSGYITALAVAGDGRLWIGTAEKGINVYDPKTDKFTRYQMGTKGGPSSEGVTAIVKDKTGRLWFTMSGGGVDVVDEKAGTFTANTKTPLDVALTAAAIDAQGHFWFGTTGEGVLRWDGTTATPFRDGGLVDAPITSILEHAGKIWIGSDGEGVIQLDPSTGKSTRIRQTTGAPTITDDHVTSLFVDKDKTLWIGTRNGLNRLEDKRITHYHHQPNDPSSLSFHGVETMFQDAGGVMWIGGFTVGLCKFDERRQQFGYHRIRNNFTTSFFEDADKTLWFGTYNDGLYKYDRANQRVTIYQELRNSATGNQLPVSLVSGTWISALHRDRRGMLWISLKGYGLVAFDPARETFKAFTPDPDDAGSLPVDSLFAIVEDRAGILWLASWGGGLVRFDPRSETFTAYTADVREDSVGMTSNHLYTLHPDPKDDKVLWVGTAKGGLVRFNTSSLTATSFKHRADDPASLSSDDIVSIYADPAGPVWVGTYGGGLNRVDPATGKAEHYTTSNSSLTNDGVLGLLPDNSGNLWMSTNGGGILRFDPKAKSFTAYDSFDGLQDNEFNQASFYRSKSGELFFGGPRGFNAFKPEAITRDTYAPPVVLTAFKVFNQDVALPRPIWTQPPLKVSYSDSFEVQFAALAMSAPKRVRYEYKLEGFDNKYIQTDRPYAAYTKLGGGNYTLKVRATNGHGVATEKEIAVKITVTPPWWRTWPAFVAYLVLIAGAVYALIRVQRERVRRAEREGRLAVVERDLALTGAVQTGFLPELNEIDAGELQVYGLYRPADACGGDWWWYEPLRNGRHVIMVGDVTGHGPGPAMVCAAVATAFRVLIENGLDDVAQGLHLLNREVLRVAKGKYHMTMSALEIDASTGRWVCYSAGAPPILTLDREGKHRVQFCPGAPLGTESGFEVGRIEGQMTPNDRILMYTDGIPEIVLPNGNNLGMRRFAQLYERTRALDLRGAASTIVQHADESRSNQPQLDDWTFTIIEWVGERTIAHVA